MINNYEEIFNAFKKYIEENSKYNPRVVKYNTNTSTYFPIITLTLANNIDTNRCTLGKYEFYEEHFYTVDIYTKDKIMGEKVTVASQIINEELTLLSNQFFNKLNMKRTLCKITPNIDSAILRRTCQYQGLIGNVRENIIRR